MFWQPSMMPRLHAPTGSPEIPAAGTNPTNVILESSMEDTHEKLIGGSRERLVGRITRCGD